jgi:2,4'-dihydroxyacetophenone dioxygenase
MTLVVKKNLVVLLLLALVMTVKVTTSFHLPSSTSTSFPTVPEQHELHQRRRGVRRRCARSLHPPSRPWRLQLTSLPQHQQQQHNDYEDTNTGGTALDATATATTKKKKKPDDNAQDFADIDDKQRQQQQQQQYVPYQGVQPPEALPEIYIQNVFSHNMPPNHENENANVAHGDDERLWVPQTSTVSFRPLCLCVSSGYYVNLLRVKGSTGVLSRHKHPNPVHGFVLKGSWKYLEHDWIARPGSYVFEPPGEIHTLVVVPSSSSLEASGDTDDSDDDDDDDDDDDEMVTLFHVTGSLLYCDPDGKVVGAEDVFTKLELAKQHYKSVGLGEDFVQQFVR